MLRDRRRELQDDVAGRIRQGRASRPHEGRDDVEASDDDNQGDLELALLQMRAEVVERIDEALGRLDAGRYGSCLECGDEIAGRRLRALPFAVRCQECQGQREQVEKGARRREQQARGTLSVFGGAAGT
jgi:DnaK suppressor protein